MARTFTLRESQIDHLIVVGDDGTVSVDNRGAIGVQPERDGEVRVGDSPSRLAWTVASGNTRWVFLDGEVYELEVHAAGGKRRAAASQGSLSAPMPASVVRVDAAPGDVV